MFIAVALVFVPCAAYLAVQLHDEHVRHCYPPANKASQRICNWTFSFHNHPLTTDAETRRSIVARLRAVGIDYAVLARMVHEYEATVTPVGGGSP